eukprot:3951689-Pleurochrysis_carterae.AAC.1
MQSTHNIECWVLCMDTVIRGVPRAALVSAGRVLAYSRVLLTETLTEIHCRRVHAIMRVRRCAS